MWRFSGSSRLGEKGKEKAERKRDGRRLVSSRYIERGEGEEGKDWSRIHACAWRPNSRHDGAVLVKNFGGRLLDSCISDFILSLSFPPSYKSHREISSAYTAIYPHHHHSDEGTVKKKSRDKRSLLFFFLFVNTKQTTRLFLTLGQKVGGEERGGGGFAMYGVLVQYNKH